MNHVLSRGAAGLGVATVGAILLAGPAMGTTVTDDGSGGVGISNRAALVRADLADIASNRGTQPPAESPIGPTGATGSDLSLVGSEVAVVLLAAAAGVTIARRHNRTAPGTA